MQHKKSLVFKERQKKLLDILRAEKPENFSQSAVILCAGFENSRYSFRQESSFYYFTGIKEPGAIFILESNGKSRLYIPHYETARNNWVADSATVGKTYSSTDEVCYAGEVYKGYAISLLSNIQHYAHVVTYLQSVVQNKGALYTLNPENNSPAYTEQYIFIDRLRRVAPEIADAFYDVAPVVARLRRKKDQQEIESLYKAVDLTMVAHEACMCVIDDGKKESEIKAGIEYIFAESAMKTAFPSIVASGKNSVVLHYTEGAGTLKKGDLVVVDIGAEFDYYCADISRTYPVSGIFNKRQKELYKIVLDTQTYVMNQARPGMYLYNKDVPEKSLHHLGKEFLKSHGYGEYFIHSIGHFLGLDVHDVGNTSEPLQEGDVITLEPGLYLPHEGTGIRIEDDYWVVKDGVVCLSFDLPREIDAIEELMQQAREDQDEDGE